IRVHPALLGKRHPLANVHGVNNGVVIEGDQVGKVSFFGRGAGEEPTASAVVADMVDIAKISRSGIRSRERVYSRARLVPVEEVRTRYYLRFRVTDRPGVMGTLTTILGKHRVSLSSVHQKETRTSPVSVVVLTHAARERDVQRALQTIAGLSAVKSRPVLIRIEDEEECR
ncbi:MAG: ACT domain-containing protein, partial [Candidatus Omnitrophica bacterium]|nr:ACT domain-containing protein [Candidatus Omnitrophota bacterium]